MFGTYSPLWILFFTLHMLLCLFGIFSQNVFMKTTVWDKKISPYCRVHLFFLSLGYQMILISFVTSTILCMWVADSIFEVQGCSETIVIPLTFHRFGECTVVVFHLLINLDHLILVFRPDKSGGRAASVYFYASCLAAFVFGVVYVRAGTLLVFLALTLLIFLNLLIEIKLFHYTYFVFLKTIGQVRLERRFELSNSVTMVRCFLPASVSCLIWKFIIIIFYIIVFKSSNNVDLPSFFFVLNLFWNLDCTLFPWFVILFHPGKKEKLMRFLQVKPPVFQQMYQKKSAVQMQKEHFDKFKNVWKIEI